LEYTLEHVASSVPVLDSNGLAGQNFNFGIGRIERGKALATERFITVPLGSADQSLLQQPQTTKTELYGRPLNGAYRLRIFDRPALSWTNLKDIQLVLNYRYWSRVDNVDQE
jgi:hypothetical protein